MSERRRHSWSIFPPDLEAGEWAVRGAAEGEPAVDLYVWDILVTEHTSANQRTASIVAGLAAVKLFGIEVGEEETRMVEVAKSPTLRWRFPVARQVLVRWLVGHGEPVVEGNA